MDEPFAADHPGPTTIHVVCPFCQASLSVDASDAGRESACPHCGGRFQVPLPTATAPGYAGAVRPEVQEFASKKIAAGICGILLGGLGVHKFILGLNQAGAIMLAVTTVGWVTGMCLLFPLLGPAAMGIIGLVEGILYLTKSDEEFYQLYAVEKKQWF